MGGEGRGWGGMEGEGRGGGRKDADCAVEQSKITRRSTCKCFQIRCRSRLQCRQYCPMYIFTRIKNSSQFTFSHPFRGIHSTMLPLTAGNAAPHCPCGCWSYDVLELEGAALGDPAGLEIRVYQWAGVLSLKRRSSTGVGHRNHCSIVKVFPLRFV